MGTVDGPAFTKAFRRIHRQHRWRGIRGSTSVRDRVWTSNMQKIVLKTAAALGLKRVRKELRRVDLTFIDKFGLPVLAVEHENGWRTVFGEEIPKLLSSSASLRVLICYPPKSKYSGVTKNLESVLTSSTEHWLRNEFLLILGPQRMAVKGEFAYFWYRPALRVSELRS